MTEQANQLFDEAAELASLARYEEQLGYHDTAKCLWEQCHQASSEACRLVENYSAEMKRREIT